MTFSPRPLVARVRRRLATVTLADAAIERVEIRPAWVSDTPPAISLPDEFERALEFPCLPELERLRVAGGPRQEGATVAWLLEDAVVGGGAVYAGAAVQSFRPEAKRLFLTGPRERRGEALLATSVSAESYFGDWLVEGLSLELLAAERGCEAVRFARKPWLHEPGYRDLTGLSAPAVTYASFDRLWIVDDRGTNPGRAARFRELRRRVRAAAPAGHGPDRVVLGRGRLGQARGCENEAATYEELARAGFVLVQPEAETPAALAGLLAHARVIVAIEGSAQVHALLAMPPDATLVIIQPPRRFTAPGKDMADMAGLRYAYVVGDDLGTGFAVDHARLMRLVALVEEATAPAPA